MKTIELNKKHYPYIESWDQLSQKQLLKVMDILFLKEYKAEQMLLKLLQVITNVSTATFFKWEMEEAEEYFYLLKFLLTPEIKFTKNILPWYQHSHTKFYGPADFLDNLRMKEFTLTEDLYMTWYDSEKKNKEALDEMVAILYRPAPSNYDFEKNPEGDTREKFNQNISQYYAITHIYQWPVNVKLAIATWYAGCRYHIVKHNPEVFSGAGDPALYGLVSVMLSVAESNVFGDFEKVEEQYVSMVMMQLNETIQKAKQLEKASKP